MLMIDHGKIELQASARALASVPIFPLADLHGERFHPATFDTRSLASKR
jgi:hypothetical protein